MSARILLFGNGPYENRGCEAIVRGTVRMLRETLGDGVTFVNAGFLSPDEVGRQNARDAGTGIEHVGVDFDPRRFWPDWVRWQLRYRAGVTISRPLPALDRAARGAAIALEIGGDNYSLDYGAPWPLLDVDTRLMRRGLPVVIWGASLGPFSRNPRFETHVLAHFRRLAALTVREPRSRAYLREHGVEANVHPVADPAFLLEPAAPLTAPVLPDGAIGLNFSPLMANYVTGGDQDAWRERAIETLLAVIAATGRDVVLVPHVTAAHDDDRGLLAAVAAGAAGRTERRVEQLPPGLTAAETKWAIAHLAAFAGARTHATIAAMSTAVPTVSLGYSVKARGLNDDVFGTTHWCVEPDASTPELIAERVREALASGDGLRAQLDARRPDLQRRARDGARVVAELLRRRTPATVPVDPTPAAAS